MNRTTTIELELDGKKYECELLYEPPDRGVGIMNGYWFLNQCWHVLKTGQFRAVPATRKKIWETLESEANEQLFYG